MQPPLKSTFADATLRLPRSEDYLALAAWVPDAKVCAQWAGPKLKFPFEAARLAGLLQEPGAQSRVLTRSLPGEASAAGFGQFWVREPAVAHLARLMVAPGERGQGLGRHLCMLLMAEAHSVTGATAFTLRVHRDNLRALGIYKKLGFVDQPVQSDAQVIFMRKADSPLPPIPVV